MQSICVRPCASGLTQLLPSSVYVEFHDKQNCHRNYDEIHQFQIPVITIVAQSFNEIYQARPSFAWSQQQHEIVPMVRELQQPVASNLLSNSKTADGVVTRTTTLSYTGSFTQGRSSDVSLTGQAKFSCSFPACPMSSGPTPFQHRTMTAGRSRWVYRQGWDWGAWTQKHHKSRWFRF